MATAKKKVTKKAAPAPRANKLAVWIIGNPIVVAAALVVIIGSAAGYAHYRNDNMMSTCTPATAQTAPKSAASGLNVTKPAQQSLTNTIQSDTVEGQTAPPESGSTLQQNAGAINQAPTSTLQAPAGTGGLDPSQF